MKDQYIRWGTLVTPQIIAAVLLLVHTLTGWMSTPWMYVCGDVVLFGTLVSTGYFVWSVLVFPQPVTTDIAKQMHWYLIQFGTSLMTVGVFVIYWSLFFVICGTVSAIVHSIILWLLWRRKVP